MILINVEKLKERIRDLSCGGTLHSTARGTLISVNRVMEAIDEMAFELLRKGVWLRHEKVVNGKVVYSDDTYVCSHCRDIWSSMTKMKFCPSCGTEMEYKDDE